jgi:cytochrome c peroxidase
MDLKHVPSILFWDGRETNLRQMVMRPIVNHIEMGITDLQQLSEKLSVIPYYKHLFKKAYGTEAVTPDKISEALTAFIASITSNNTKFDKALRGQLQLSALEAHGRNLFFEKYDCNACHQVQSSSGYIQAGTFSNIGLDKVYQDQGVAEVTKNDSDIGKFKIPSLRNVMFTAPYMHDGRFETLEEVLDHYSHGVEDHPNLDVRLKDQSGKPLVLNISQDEKRAIIAFLATLTDTDMLNHPKFANPFKTH